MQELFNSQNWMNIWGAIILIGLPILFVFATMVYRRRKPSGKGLVPPQIVRFLFVPFLTIHLILSKIIGFSEKTILIKVSETIIIIIMVSFLFNVINYLFFSKNNILTKREIIPKLGRDVLHIFLITIIGAGVLSNIWGLNLGHLLTAFGVSSLVIGLALQEPLGNLFNGIFLLMATPFKRGDWISIGDEIGKVSEINWRSVKIHTRFNEEVIIPNNMLGKEKIKNLSRPNKIHAELLKFGFSYNDAPEKIKAALLEIATKNDSVLATPPPAVFTLSFDDFAITYGLKLYVRDYEDIILLNDQILFDVYYMAEQQGFTIPFPRHEIDLKERED